MDNPPPAEKPPAPLPPPAPEPVAAPPPPPSMPAVPWQAPRPHVERSMARWKRWAVPLILFVSAFGYYQFNVDHPPIVVFDEAHYIKVARNYTRGVMTDPAWGDPRPQNFEHPPLGKYFIAAGIWLNGKPHDDWENQRYITQLCGHDNEECRQDAWGWRFSSTIVGASGIAAAYLLGMRLFNRVSAGLFTASLLALDGLYYMHARLAMLDIFPTVFSIWAFAWLFSPFRSGRWLAAVFLGLALASKYYVLYLVPLFILAQFIKAGAPRWQPPPPPVATDAVTGARTESTVDLAHGLRLAWHPVRPWLIRLGWAGLLGAIIPFVVLLGTYAPYFWMWTEMHGPAFAVKEWIHVQVAAFRWDFAGKATHPFSSEPWTWVPMIRPVFYYTFDYPSGLVGKMYSLGNPFVWWTASAGLIAVPIFILVRFFRTQAKHFVRWDFLDRIVHYPFFINRDISFLLAALFFYSMYVPWFIVQRILFIFYMTFVTPAFALFAGGLLGEQYDRGGFPRVLSLLYATIALGVFGIFYPVVAGTPISRTQFEWVMSLIPWMHWR